MAKLSKLDRIYQELVLRIRSGIYVQGQRLPTENSLCSEFSASRPTISRALAKLRSEGVISSTQGSGHYLMTQENEPAQAPLQHEVQTFGILSPRMEENESGFLFEQIFKSIASLSQRFNFDLIWNGVMTLGAGATRQAVLNKIDNVIERYLRSNVRGVFFIPIEFHPYAAEINQLILNKLDRDGLGVVLLDSDVVPWPKRSHWDLIGIDNVAAGQEVTTYLLNNQPRRIDFLCERFSANTVNMRKMGYRLALLDAGIVPQTCWEHEGNVGDSDFIEHLLASGAQDIICANDFTAMKLLSVCGQNGRKINVVGFDDNEYSALLGIPLTTYKQPFNDIARHAVFTMLDRLQYPDSAARHLQINGELIIRASCRWREV
ncbi:DNA-binding transcriptional regulator CytR [Yersinia pekkanenii]|uniref:DNA-binding transcriptional regulator CytR n=2 Tax=Yersinia pekkanenii TaxID=1288385 RepID=A0A0T9P0L8_9GAMM|nr:DNA-binding transcriptional regulator CytR [Yersinia pekkanenii]CRY66931.1 DNA-binding transcriptional regulator CytR [Yersinia pekkanenii]